MGNYDSGRATDLGGISVEQRRADSLAGIRFNDSRSDPTSSNDVILYRNGTSLYWWNGTSATNLSSGAGGGGNDTLDSAYDNGRTIQVSGGAVTLAGVNEDTSVLAITGDGDSAGALISFTHTTATRNDLLGTGSSWKITGQGAITATALVMADNELITLGTGSDATIGWNGSVLNIAGVVDFDNNVTLAASATIIQTGAAGSTVFTITAGDVVMSDSSLAITDADNAETVTIINNTATTIGAAASAGVLQVESTSLTTGVLINAQSTEGTLNGGFYFGAWDATAGARVFGVGENGVLTVTGAGGASALTITAGDVVFSDASLAITDADNAETVTIINNTATTIGASATAGIVQVESTSLTTGAAVNVQLTEGTLNGGFYYSAWDATAGARVFSVGEDGAVVITGVAANVLTITLGNAVLTAGNLVLTLGNATLTDGNFTISEGKVVATSTADEAVATFTGNASAVSQPTFIIVQDHTTAANAVLRLQQDDVSEEFIEFNSTAGSGQAVDLTNTTPAAVVGSVIVSAVDGTKYRMALYAAAGWS